METATPYKFPPLRETVYIAVVEIKRQSGKYELKLEPQPATDPEIAKRVQAALADVINELNA